MGNSANKKRTILIIDDEEDFVKGMAIALEIGEYTVLEAYDGVQGIRVFEQNYRLIDLVICDLFMPHISGTAVIQRILQINPAVPLIIMSGSVDEDSLPNLINHPSCSYLQKPFSMQKLVECVGKMISLDLLPNPPPL